MENDNLPIYSKVDYGPGGAVSLDGWTPSFLDSVSAGWSAAMDSNPWQAMKHSNAMTGAMGPDLVDEVELPEGETVSFEPRQNQDVLPMAEQERLLKEAGMEGMIKPHAAYNAQALDLLIRHKSFENDLALLSEKAPAWHIVPSMAAGLAASMADPINIATSFFPGISQARQISMLKAAGDSAWKRAGVRALAGGIGGAAGSALAEPMIHHGMSRMQADYDYADSLLNIGFGTIMGASLQPLAGRVGDYVRSRKFKKFLADSEAAHADTADLREKLAGEMEKNLLLANPDLDPEKTRARARELAMLRDLSLRKLARERNVPIREAWNMPEFRAGMASELGLEMEPQAQGRSGPDAEPGPHGEFAEAFRDDFERACNPEPFPEKFDDEFDSFYGEKSGALEKEPQLLFHDDPAYKTNLPAISDDRFINFWSDRQAAQTNLFKELSEWNNEVDKISKTGRAPSTSVKMLSQTPLVLDLIGRDKSTGMFPGKGGIYAAAHMFKGHHPDISPDILKNIPRAMVDPIAILDSETTKGAVVFMLELKNANGGTIIVPLEFKARHPYLKTLDVNIATSAYAKGKGKNINDKWFLDQLAKNSRYVNEEKIKRWQSFARVQSPVVTYSNASGNKIFTFADLVNFEAESGPLYQTPPSSPSAHGGEQKAAKVVDIDPSLLVDKNGAPIDWKDKRALSEWLREHFAGKTVRIEDDGTLQVFTRKNLQASLKRRGQQQREAYAALDDLLRLSIYDQDIEADARHAGKVAGQKIYYAAARIGGEHFSVRIKLDKPLYEGNPPSYKDHKVEKIEIAPSLSLLRPEKGLGSKAESAISAISLDILRGKVKPSRLENDILYQSSPAQSSAGDKPSQNPANAPAQAAQAAQGKLKVFEGGEREGRELFTKSSLPSQNLSHPQDLLPEPPGRGSVRFVREDGRTRAIISFYRSADITTASHELYHVLRREFAEAAADPNASGELQAMWREAEKFVGAAPGERWTREMEEKFARAGERFLLEGIAPSARLLPAFERLREQFIETYEDADAAGLEISPGMRETFNKMLSTPFEEADRAFRQALGDILLRRWEDAFAPHALEAESPAPGRPAGADGPEAGGTGAKQAGGELDPLEDLELQKKESAELEADLAELAGRDPEAYGPLLEVHDLEMRQANEHVEHERQMGRALMEAVQCETKYGD